MIVDLPNKVLNAVAMNLILYFMANLRREPGPFFFFFLVSFTMTLAVCSLPSWLSHSDRFGY
jgi:ABC-type multidrug transport system permease subunit